MFNLPKNIQSNFSGRKNVIYMQSIITYILVDYSLGAQRNVCLKNSTWVAEKESESAVSDMLEFCYKFRIF